MCNLYSITTNQPAIIALFRVMNRYVGNLPPMPGVFANQLLSIASVHQAAISADHSRSGYLLLHRGPVAAEICWLW
jgi:hypothetical protein